MKKRKRNNLSVQLEPLSASWLDTLFNPNVEMAAELMNVPVNVVEEWLAQEHLAADVDDKLSEAAIDFLADKYASRLHRYFDNCLVSWDTLDAKERELFSQFKRKYGKLYHLWKDEWKDIDEKRIVKDFKAELKKKGQDYYFDGIEGFEPFEFPAIVVKGYNEIDAYPVYYLDAEPGERRVFLFSISHSLYYGSRIKTRIPARPEHRDIVLETLQENRFHIFIGESEDNVQIEAISSSTNANQPQLAIVPVFGYPRHKNNLPHEIFNKNKAYFSCPS